MQFHPKSGRFISPVTAGDTDPRASRVWPRGHELAGRGLGPSAERVAQIRQRVESGYYNSATAMNDLAGVLLAAGAL